MFNNMQHSAARLFMISEIFIRTVYVLILFSYKLFELFRWIKYLTEAAEVHSRRDGKCKRPEHTPDAEEEAVQELPSHRDQAERAESVGGEASSCLDADSSNSGSSLRNSEVLDDDKDKRLNSDVDQQCSSSTDNGM